MAVQKIVHVVTKGKQSTLCATLVESICDKANNNVVEVVAAAEAVAEVLMDVANLMVLSDIDDEYDENDEDDNSRLYLGSLEILLT